MSADTLPMASLRAMILVSLADGDVRDDEIDVIQSRWRELTGTPPSRDLVIDELRTAVHDPEITWDRIARAPLSDADKEEVLRSVVVACIADAELQEAEIALLNRMAGTLGVKPGRVRGVMSQVWRESRGA